MDPFNNKWLGNECTKPGCEARPGEPCIWTGTPNERFPEPAGTPREPHAGRKYTRMEPPQVITP